MARLMLALRLTAEREPQYSEYLDKIILRWNFCPVIDREGELWSSSLQNGQPVVREELRLGESEYAATAFQLWGFSPEKAFTPPAHHVIIAQRRLASMPGIRAPRGSPPDHHPSLYAAGPGVWLGARRRCGRSAKAPAQAGRKRLAEPEDPLGDR
jgi:hypothetical protein